MGDDDFVWATGGSQLGAGARRMLGDLAGLVPVPLETREPCSLVPPALQAMCDQAGVLTGVRYGSYPDAPSMVWVVRLSFESGGWSLVAVPDDDTVLVTGLFETDDAVFADAPDGSPWRSALGKCPRWIWALTNQQGYLDGIQFDFTPPGGGDCFVQMIVSASAWRMRGW